MAGKIVSRREFRYRDPQNEYRKWKAVLRYHVKQDLAGKKCFSMELPPEVAERAGRSSLWTMTAREMEPAFVALTNEVAEKREERRRLILVGVRTSHMGGVYKRMRPLYNGAELKVEIALAERVDTYRGGEHERTRYMEARYEVPHDVKRQGVAGEPKWECRREGVNLNPDGYRSDDYDQLHALDFTPARYERLLALTCALTGLAEDVKAFLEGDGTRALLDGEKGLPLLAGRGVEHGEADHA